MTQTTEKEQPQPLHLDTPTPTASVRSSQGGTEDLDESMISGAVLRQAGGKIKDVVTGNQEEATDRLTGQGAKA